MSSIHTGTLIFVSVCLIVTQVCQGRAFQVNSGGPRLSQVKSLDNPSLSIAQIHSVVGVLDLGNDTEVASSLEWLADSRGFSCALFGESRTLPLARLSKLPQDDAMVLSLGILCDALVLVLPNEETDEIERMVLLLNQIASKRQAQSLPKGRLVVISPLAKDPGWVQGVVQQSLKSITPALWDSFDILVPDDLGTQWKPSILSHPGSIGTILSPSEDADVLTSLLEKMHEAFGGVSSQGKFALSVMKPSTGDDMERDDLGRDSTDLETGRSDVPLQQIRQVAQSRVLELESKMEATLLDSHSANHIPLLEFGRLAHEIIHQAYEDLAGELDTARLGVIQDIVAEIGRLYRDHLQSLREYYGRRYEEALEGSDDEEKWTLSADHMTQGFRSAAQNAVPTICQVDNQLAGIVQFNMLEELQGLVADMMESTQGRKDEQDQLVQDESETTTKKRWPIPKWVKKVASRAVALGVNYVQGWLAWQAIKRAAIERDREMPKFPLF